jgi:hypothetical protein
MFTKLKKNMSRLKKSGELQFSLDKADNEAIAGWAFDPTNIDLAVSIEIRQGSNVLWSSSASNLRQDLLDAGISDGKHGFHCQFSDDLSQPINGAIDVYAAGQKINTSEIIVNFQPSDVIKAKPIQELGNLKYHFDKISVEVIHGWARILDNDTDKLSVECKVGDIVVGSTVADQLRVDLKVAGIGDGYCSFTLKPEFSSLPDKEARFSLYLGGCLVPFDQFSMLLSAEDVAQLKLNEQVAKFSTSVKDEIGTITTMIQKQNMNEGLPADSVAGVCHVLIEKVAEINTRISVIETAILKHIE